MKETKLTKRIFAVFVAFIVILLISCGDLQVFAETGSLSLTYYQGRWDTDFQLAYYNGSSWVVIASNNSDAGTEYTLNLTLDFGLYRVRNWYMNTRGGTQFNSIFKVNDTLLSTDINNPTPVSPNSHIFRLMNGTSETNNFIYYYFYFGDNATPTPTPTPVPTPTPEPTFNPDQPTYTTFFNHLLNDGNNALNALYLSWTQANNKFYTGIFFIGLPIMIGIFGIVASIFFGGDD